MEVGSILYSISFDEFAAYTYFSTEHNIITYYSLSRMWFCEAVYSAVCAHPWVKVDTHVG